MDSLTGSVERITFYNPENGYTVLRLRPERGRPPGLGRDGLATVVGNLPEVTPGETLVLEGRWSQHAAHGLQFQAETCRQALPATTAGIRRYLGSGLVRGIGPRLAERIVARFGAETLEVIENAPQRLQEVEDIGPRRTLQIAAAWEEQKQVKEIMLFLHGQGLSAALAVKIYKQYGDQSLPVVQNDPYRLAQDVSGIGFKTADRIAQTLGLPADHPSRLEAGLVHALNEMSNDGHVYAPQDELAGRAAELLGLPAGQLAPALERLEAEGRVVRAALPAGQIGSAGTAAAEPPAAYGEQPAVYLAGLFAAEAGLAQRLAGLASAMPSRLADLPPAFIALDPALSPRQQAGVRAALSHPLSVLTGGPGTGKTTAMRALIGVVRAAHKRFALASPTGRAARRLAEAAGHPASTIHRLLGPSPAQGFKHNAANPLPLDLLVVDEASMLDLSLAYHLVKALEPGTHLLLVGDVDQLPSVGAGDVLRDIIASGAAAVTRLDQIFRQAADSHIITNAHRINQGQTPLFEKDSRDFFLFPAETAEDAARWVTDLVCERIPRRYGLDPRSEIQVLAPMYRGPAGVNALNAALQDALNPPAANQPEKMLFGERFRPGDRVMQLQNNYDKDVFNGDIGRLKAIDLAEHTLEVDFDGRAVIYDWSEADQLTLAYAVSVHKAQGSEFPAVVLPLLTSHYMMLQRNLLYTGVTRARSLCVLVGSRRAISMAVNNDRQARRYTALDWRLRQF